MLKRKRAQQSEIDPEEREITAGKIACNETYTQEDEKFERLPLKLEPAAIAAQLKFAAMKAEVAELIDDKWHHLPPQRR